MRRNRLVIAGMVLCAGFAPAGRAAEDAPIVRGEWSLNNWTLGDSVFLRVKHGTTTIGWQPALTELRGLEREQLHALRSPVKFGLVRDAGSFVFEGTLTLGIGGGSYLFLPDASFSTKLAALGYDPVEPDGLFTMALEDVSLEYAREVKQSGIRDVGIRDLLRFHDHGVGLDFLRDLGSIGYSGLTAGGVVELHDHGVPSGLLRTLKASGATELAAGDITRLHDHGVDSEFVADLAKSGMSPPSVDELIQLHDHGVEPRYVARMRAAGFQDLSVAEIVKLHDHGVD